jgi:hypothetical protein
MIVFNGKYRWDGKKKGDRKPVSWWPGSYRITIIDLSDEKPGVHMLKPIIVMAAETKEGFCLKNTYQDLVKNVCIDFNLQTDKVFWVSYNAESFLEMQAAVFRPVSRLGSEILYDIRWRPVIDRELDEIKRFFPESAR